MSLLLLRLFVCCKCTIQIESSKNNWSYRRTACSYFLHLHPDFAHHLLENIATNRPIKKFGTCVIGACFHVSVFCLCFSPYICFCFDACLQDILMTCWAYKPSERTDFKELLKVLDRLPKKRLARSPSHPIQLSRSAESVF